MTTADAPAPTSSRCLARYNGSLWRGKRCREQADHAAVAHVDAYEWSGKTYRDDHTPHAHHVDQYGRSWSTHCDDLAGGNP